MGCGNQNWLHLFGRCCWLRHGEPPDGGWIVSMGLQSKSSNL